MAPPFSFLGLGGLQTLILKAIMGGRRSFPRHPSFRWDDGMSDGRKFAH